MKMKRNVLRLLSALLCLLTFTVSAFARGPVDPAQPVSLRVTHPSGVSGAVFRLYRVADIAVDASFTPVDAFSHDGLRFASDDQDGWQSLALTCKAIVDRDGLTPSDSGETDASGVLLFPTASSVTLLPGLYLLLSDPMRSGAYDYSASATLLVLPALDGTDAWQYAVSAAPKIPRTPVPDTPEPPTTSRKILKIWDDAGLESERPASITVCLYRNGVLYDTRTLTANDRWETVWSDLPLRDASGALIDWSVSELPVPGYTSRVGASGLVLTVTNSREHPAPLPDIPSGPLPQTGLNFLPILLLSVSGLLCLFAALVLRRRSSR